MKPLRGELLGLSSQSQTAPRPSGVGLWMRIMRVPFLQATLIPVTLGGVIAWQVVKVFRWDLFLLTLLGASLIQIATNMFNDYFDFKSGNDLQVKHQNPFAGGGRILSAGLITPTKHFLVSSAFLLLGCLIGLYFVFVQGLTSLFWLGLIGVISSYFYVGPPFKLAHRGIGEFIVGVNFGPVMTIGAYYVQTGTWTNVTEPLLAPIPFGLLFAAFRGLNSFLIWKRTR